VRSCVPFALSVSLIICLRALSWSASLLLRVCLALLCVMFIAYLVASLLLRVCLALPVAGERRGPRRIVCFFGHGERVMMGKLCVSLAGEAVIPQCRKRYKGRAR